MSKEACDKLKSRMFDQAKKTGKPISGDVARKIERTAENTARKSDKRNG